MTDTLPIAPGAQGEGFFARFWIWLCHPFATPVTTMHAKKGRPKGPWDRPDFTVYVAGFEVACIEETAHYESAERDPRGFAVHSFARPSNPQQRNRRRVS